MSSPQDIDPAGAPANRGGILAPLQLPVFRGIWFASLLSNLGLLIGGVGGAWAMTQLTPAPDMVALVQTAMTAPVMLVALWAGAMADMYDRRRLGLVALCIALVSSVSLAALGVFGQITPPTLLTLTFLIGCGMALFGPAWQASVGEQVPPNALPSAIALNSISYNIARSFGPAVGGMIVAAAGASAAFATNALLYLPLLIVLFRWRRVQEPPRLPPERLTRAVVSGIRYVVHSPPIRIVLTRTFVMGSLGGSISALMPVVARDLLHGGAQVFGVILGCFGLGAVLGALSITAVRRRLSGEAGACACALTMGAALAVVGVSRSPPLTAAVLVAAGAAWMIAITLFNVAVQLSAPRWVAGRALSTFQTATAGGIAIGSWGWGRLASGVGVGLTLVVAGGVLAASAALGVWLRTPSVRPASAEPVGLLADPEVALALTPRSGPIVVEIAYRVEPRDARPFYRLMQEVQLMRQRNGAYSWSIARDIADPAVWVERFACSTWLDYLRHRNRPTQDERALQDRARAFHVGAAPLVVRRMLERPFGSVRWKDEAPDHAPTLPTLSSEGS